MGASVPTCSTRPETVSVTSRIAEVLGLVATESGRGLSVHSSVGTAPQVQFEEVFAETTRMVIGPGGAGTQKVMFGARPRPEGQPAATELSRECSM